MGTNPSTSPSPVSPTSAMRASLAAASVTARADEGGDAVQSTGSSASIASLRASSGVVNRSATASTTAGAVSVSALAAADTSASAGDFDAGVIGTTFGATATGR